MLKIYELPKIYNKITKILSTTSRNNNHLPGHFYFPTSSGFLNYTPINFIGNVD